jgi:hypothetical protein
MPAGRLCCWMAFCPSTSWPPCWCAIPGSASRPASSSPMPASKSFCWAACSASATASTAASAWSRAEERGHQSQRRGSRRHHARRRRTRAAARLPDRALARRGVSGPGPVHRGVAPGWLICRWKRAGRPGMSIGWPLAAAPIASPRLAARRRRRDGHSNRPDGFPAAIVHLGGHLPNGMAMDQTIPLVADGQGDGMVRPFGGTLEMDLWKARSDDEVSEFLNPPPPGRLPAMGRVAIHPRRQALRAWT